MSTKKSKASSEQSPPNEINATPPAKPAKTSPPAPALPSSPAKTVQAISANPGEAVKLPVTARLENGFEYHLDLVRDVIDGILDPDVPDVFLEIPCPIANTRRFLHTSMIKEVDVRGLE